MEKEQEEIQFLGFFGIFKESFNIIGSCRNIICQITLSLILPLSFIFLAHIEISELLFAKILHNEYALGHTQPGTTRYSKLSDVLSSEWTTFWLFKLAYFVFSLVLSLLSTSAIVYTIACVYTAKEITLKRVMSVVPKVWKRLMVTFLWYIKMFLVYNFFALLVFLVMWVLFDGPTTICLTILFILAILYLMGFVYLSVVWNLACVVSVLEDVYGIQAMVKSKGLIKGKMGISVAIFLLFNMCFVGIQVAYERFVVGGGSLWYRIGLGSLCLNLLVMLVLFGLVIQTLIYFICKSYHHENIDKSSLADHLEVYLGDYVPLQSKDLPLEQFYV